MILCLECEHHMFTDLNDWKLPQHFCCAVPLESTQDPITGEQMTKYGDQKYEFCREVNKGNCKLFVEKK